MSRVRRALKSETAGKSAWGLVEQAVGLTASLLTATLLASTVGAESYGAYAGVYALMGPFLAVIQGGMSLAVLDQIVREKQDPQAVARAFMGFTMTAGPFFAIVVSVLAGRFIEGISVLAGTLFIVSELAIMATLAASTATIQASRGYVFASRVRTLTMGCKIAVLLALRLTDRLDMNSLAVVQTSAFLLVALSVHRWQESLVGFPLRPGRYGKQQLTATAVYAVGIGASTVQNSYDQTVLSSTHKGDAGRYAAAYRIVSMGLLPLGAIANATHTDFLDAEAGSDDQMRKARRFAALGLAYSAVFCTVVFFGASLVPKILGEDYEESVSIIRWLVPLVPLRGITTFPMNGLLGLGRNKLRTQMLVTGAVLSLVLYFSLIPAYSWKGAVAGTLISEAALFVAAWVALFRCQAQARRSRQEPVPVG